MADKLESVELKVGHADLEDDEKKVQDVMDRPLTAEELEKIANTPFWRRIRLITIIFFWVVWALMLGLTVYVVVNAKASADAPAVCGDLDETDVPPITQVVMHARDSGSETAIKPPIVTCTYLLSRASDPQLITTPITPKIIASIKEFSNGTAVYARTKTDTDWKDEWTNANPNLKRYFDKFPDSRNELCDFSQFQQRTYYIDEDTDRTEAKFMIYALPKNVLFHSKVAETYKPDTVRAQSLWNVDTSAQESCGYPDSCEDTENCAFVVKFPDHDEILIQ